MNLYGLDYDDDADLLQIEFEFIRNGGYIEEGGHKFGKGKFHHIRQAMSLIWPDDDHHRWSDLLLRRKCEEDILVIMGSGDSNKTYFTSRYVLIDYWIWPTNTLWMVSSTELRGAELRIWGRIKDLFNAGRERYPWLPGSVLDARTCITTDEIDREGKEARSLTRGIIFIPCKREENWVGLGSYSGIKPPKNGRLGHAGDEVSFMERSFLQAYANWYGKKYFQGILQGNITDTEDPLGVASEPVGGWSSWMDTGKTQEWRSKWYYAWVVALDGRDSPNDDYPGVVPRYHYLISAKKRDGVRTTEGEDSDLYWMQCVGKPRPGSEKFKVISMQLCEQNGAFDEPVWSGTAITDVLSLDAAYGGVGGDRCVLMHNRFGQAVNGQTIFACQKPMIVPISQQSPDRPETQIARFCRDYGESHGIPPSHFFYDARATLAAELARVWSPDCNAVDFGGMPTDRPVAQDVLIEDPVTKLTRLKRCNEHYSKFVTELWYTFRYMLIGKQVRSLPRDVAEEGSKRLWHPTKGSPIRVELETKDEMKVRTKRSPDLFDALVTGVEGARRLGFEIRTITERPETPTTPDDWLRKATEKRKAWYKKHELNYQ